MFLENIKNLLAKRLVDGVAPKTPAFNIRLSGSRVLRKLKIFKLLAITVILPYLFAYQPALSVPPVKKAAVHAQDSAQTIEALKLDSPFILPHPGYLSTRYSFWHPGVDIATGLGMPIHPVNKGKVAGVVYGFFGFGHYVVVDHGQGLKSTYAHMGRIFVKVNDEVSHFTIIGEVGMTGRTSGPHTHLEITKDGSYLNPEGLLPKLPDWPNPQLLEQQKALIPAGGYSQGKSDKVNLKKELSFTL